MIPVVDGKKLLREDEDYQYGSPPTVGLGCTFICWSDRHPGTVAKVSENKRKIWVRRCLAVRTDNNGMSESQRYDYYEPGPSCSVVEIYTKRKNGRWVAQGAPMRNGPSLGLGYRNEYYDYSF